VSEGREPLRATTHIRIPPSIAGMLKAEAIRENVPIWVVVERALSFYFAQYRAHFANTGNLDKCAWYAFKLASSIGEFKGEPSERNRDLLLKTVRQVRDRIGVNTEVLEGAIERFHTNPSPKNRMVLNNESKLVIAQIIVNMLGVEKK